MVAGAPLQMARIPVILNPRAGVRNVAREEEIRAAFASHGVFAEIKNADGTPLS